MMEVIMSAPTILQVNSSARLEGSVSRELSQLLSWALAGESGAVTVRDLAETPVPQVDAGLGRRQFHRSG
jgi:FMN-dependent NADH-azoreductase